MTLTTEAEAKAKICPIARVSGAKEPKAKCQGADCILWRWVPLMADDPRVLAAIARETLILKTERPKDHQIAIQMEALRRVRNDPHAYSYPTETDRGWCGLGGKPE
jgi:hypothetical protein